MRRLLPALSLLLVLLTVAIPAAAGAKTIVVGCDANLKPFEFKGENGKYVGFDIEVWEAIAAELKLDYTLKPMSFEELIPALEKGAIDVALAGLTINADREKVIDFSYPYFDSGLSVMVHSDRDDIYGIGALTDKIIATKKDTTSAEFAQNIQQKKVILFPDIEQAYQEVAAGRADAVIYDSPALLYYINTEGRGKLKSVGGRYEKQAYGIAFPQGSPLRERVNIALLKLIENGRYDIISRKWFGTMP